MRPIFKNSHSFFVFFFQLLNKSSEIPYTESGSAYRLENLIYPLNVTENNFFPLSQSQACLPFECSEYRARLYFSNNNPDAPTYFCDSGNTTFEKLVSCNSGCQFAPYNGSESFLIDFKLPAIEFSCSKNFYCFHLLLLVKFFFSFYQMIWKV